jgi:uncharacterized phage protein (TIGR01671 family)
MRKLSQTDKEAIVADLRAGKTTIKQLTTKYTVAYPTIYYTVKRQLGRSLTEYQQLFTLAKYTSRYRAWHTLEKKMYPVLGLNWLDQMILIDNKIQPVWQPMDHFILMNYAALKDLKGQELCTGDIIQFPIIIDGQETIVKDIVAFSRVSAMFLISNLDEPLAMYNDTCEIIGTVYTNPEMVNNEMDEAWQAFA